ncbi:MAG: hypothetical protein CFE33_20320 [Pseudorhodobacter sp. PARRP1]|nr:MAG: hypothetical protein CFE33_20320 [Pseudorhodobacter sp. PARRP1]
MGKVTPPAVGIIDRLNDILNEVLAYIVVEQPELAARVHKDMIVVEGKLLVGPTGAWFDVYDVLLVFLPGFPNVEPLVWEVASRVPRTADRHVFPKDGNCCLGVWEEWLICAPSHTVADFMSSPLQSYFESQTYFEMHADWPYGQRSHGIQGVVEAFADVLGVAPRLDLVRDHLAVLAREHHKGHHVCPCGSGRRLRKCHLEQVRAMAGRVSPNMARRMLEGLPKDQPS